MTSTEGISTNSRCEWLFLLVCLALAAFVRLDFLLNNNFVIDADEAIVGLMAKHISQGQSFPTFYYGQHYMGSFEPIVASLLYGIFGNSSAALKSVPFFFSLALIVISFLISKRLMNSFGAAIVALLLALPPSALVIWSAMARGGFIELLFIGYSAIYFFLCWWPKPLAQEALPCLLLSAALLGFGWWTNNQIIYFMLPCAILAAVRISLMHALSTKARFLLTAKFTLLSLICFFLGGAPFWFYNFNNRFASFGIFHLVSPATAYEHSRGVINIALPILLGAKRFWHTSSTWPYSTSLVLMTYAFILAIGFYYLWRSFSFERFTRFPLELFYLFIAGLFLIFSFSSYGHLVEAPRYLLPIYPALFILVGFALSKLAERQRFLASMLAALLVGINLASCYWGGRAIPGEPFVANGERVSKDHTQLIAWLKENNIKWVRTNYWIGYRLAFETAEQVRPILFAAPRESRIHSYLEETSTQEKNLLPIILVPSQLPGVTAALSALGYSFDLSLQSGYQIVYNLHQLTPKLQLIDNRKLKASSNYGQLSSANALDNDLHTRWASAHPQTADMSFEITLQTPTALRAIEVGYGDWPQDYARKLKISARTLDNQELELLNPAGYEFVREFTSDSGFLIYNSNQQEIRSLALKQMSFHPVLDWSLAEIRLYQ